MELLNIIIDKCITMITKLKNKREELKLLSDCGEEFQKVKNDYVNNICKEFLMFIKNQKDILLIMIMIFI